MFAASRRLTRPTSAWVPVCFPSFRLQHTACCLLPLPSAQSLVRFAYTPQREQTEAPLFKWTRVCFLCWHPGSNELWHGQKQKKKWARLSKETNVVFSWKQTKRLLFVNATPNSLFSSRLALRIRRVFLFYYFMAARYQNKRTVFRMIGSSFFGVKMVTLIVSQVSCYTAAYRAFILLVRSNTPVSVWLCGGGRNLSTTSNKFCWFPLANGVMVFGEYLFHYIWKQGDTS